MHPRINDFKKIRDNFSDYSVNLPMGNQETASITAPSTNKKHYSIIKNKLDALKIKNYTLNSASRPGYYILRLEDKKMENKLSLKDILNEWGINKNPELTEEDKTIFFEKIKNFNTYGESVYNKANLRKIAEELSKLTDIARHVILSETDEWFDKVTINRNMKSLDNISKEFLKTASEAQSIQERLATLYEDMGTIFNRYFDVQSQSPANTNVDGDLVKKTANAVRNRDANKVNKDTVIKTAKAIKRRNSQV